MKKRNLLKFCCIKLLIAITLMTMSMQLNALGRGFEEFYNDYRLVFTKKADVTFNNTRKQFKTLKECNDAKPSYDAYANKRWKPNPYKAVCRLTIRGEWKGLPPTGQ